MSPGTPEPPAKAEPSPPPEPPAAELPEPPSDAPSPAIPEPPPAELPEPPPDAPSPPDPAHRGTLVVALVLLAAVLIAEILGAVFLKPPLQAHHETSVLAERGVSRMLQGVPVDQSELAQVAHRQHQPAPLVFLSLALLDGLVLVGGLAVAAPQLGPVDARGRSHRLSAFLPSLAVLLGGVAVVVIAIGRLRLLAGWYLSPPYGTLDYLLAYGVFRRSAALALLALLMVLKLVAMAIFGRHRPRAVLRRGMPGLVLTSMAAMLVTVASYGMASSSTGSLADAFAAAVVALAAIFWAGVIVSGSVRRLG
ncbi:MAG: hypothetical protein ACRDZ8_15070 [Acidimicrobiales bacterium]